MLIQCCVCKKIEDDGNWEPADCVIYDASHTYCPECARNVRDEIRMLQKAGLSQSHRGAAAPALRNFFKPPFYSCTDTEGR